VAKADLAASHEDLGAVTSSEIRAQLERILASSDFNVPERAHAFLKYVVTETLSDRADRIKAYSIAIEVFGRGASFDPQSDPVVRIEAGRVRRALERYYLTAGSSDPIAITIPKGSYVPTFSRNMQDAGQVSPEPKPPSPPEPFYLKGRLRTSSLVLSAFAVIILVIAAWAVFQWPTFLRKAEVASPGLDARGPNIPKLLVEPFKDATGTAEGATIAIGLTEEVVEKLARFKDLVVVLSDPRRPDTGTSSAMRYALGGSVRVEGDDIRLYARLTDRTKGSILWANSYDGSRTVRRLLDVEGDVARDVATALGQPYGTIFQTDAAQALQGPPEDWEAYACTLAYYSYRTILDQPTHASVKQCLERAVARFPGYTTAWALLSLTYFDELRFHYRNDTTAPARLDQALEAAGRAVALDPTNVRALQAQMLGLFFKNEVDAALRVGERAVALNPNDTELVGEYGMRRALSGDWVSGCPLIEQAHTRNPASQPDYEVMLALCSYMQRDYQKALFWVRRADLQKSPLYHFVVGAIDGQLGDATAAERERQWILANAPGLLRDIHYELQMRIKEPRDQEHFLDGLKRAGFLVPDNS
jgi:TolB-like protein